MCCICWALLNVFAFLCIFLHVLKDLLCKATLCVMQKLTPQIEMTLSFWRYVLHSALEWQMSSQAAGKWQIIHWCDRTFLVPVRMKKRRKCFVWCGRASMKTINGQLLLVVILCVSRDSRCHRGEWTDAAWKGFTSTWTLGKMPLSCAWGIITNTGCWTSVGIASHWCD